MTERLRHSLDKPLRKLDEQASVGDRIVHSWIVGTLKREPTPFKETLDRVDGKIPGDGVALNFTSIKILVVREEPKQLTEQVQE